MLASYIHAVTTTLLLLLLSTFLPLCSATRNSIQEASFAARATAATRTVNAYCVPDNKQVPCNVDLVVEHSNIINSLSPSMYRLNIEGLIETCSHSTPTCQWPSQIDAEAFVLDLYEKLQRNTSLKHPIAITPLVFNNDGTTVQSFRAMMQNQTQAVNIKRLVAAAVANHFTGISLDLEPSCWIKNVSQCVWPTRQDSQDYLQFLSSLGTALAAVNLPLQVCADHEVCDVDCGAHDEYVEQCAHEELTWTQCNCCAFASWFNASALCHADSQVFKISVMDSYASAPWNETDFLTKVSPWFRAGCQPERLSFGLLSDEAQTAQDIDQMFSSLNALSIQSLDIWNNPYQSQVVTGLWSDSLQQYLNGRYTEQDALVEEA